MEIMKKISLMSSYRFWAGSSMVVSILSVKFAPQYSLRQSYFWTAVAAFLLQWTVYGIYTVILYPRYFSPLRHLPSVPGGSFINGQWWTIIKEQSGEPLRRWASEVPNDGLIHYLHLFNRDRLLVTSPKALAEVLTLKTYDFIKPSFVRTGLGRLLGVGILLAEGDEHKAQRKNLMPAFAFRHVKELYPIFWKKSREMVVCIEEDMVKKNNTIETGAWSGRASLDIIGVAGMGQDFNSLADPNTELNKTYRTIFQPSRGAQILGILSFLLPSAILERIPIKRNNDVVAASKVARDTSRRLVELKREKMAKKEALNPDIISVALESGGFDTEALVNNMMTFLAAGHETTSSAFGWAIYSMCKKPEVQTRLREEIRGHVASLSDEMDSATLDGMPYLHAVCNETLRVYPSVSVTIREAGVDTSILGHFVPKGTKVVLSPWAINVQKEFWGPDAEEFNPDRWMAPGQANSGGATSNYAFLTFLHGPRSCIGQRFAQAELASLVAAFVGRFEFELVNPDEVLEIKGGFARPKQGINIKIKVVEGW